ncbi:MAG: DUF4861 domain-containing protein, partial [Bacteroidota bacterium]
MKKLVTEFLFLFSLVTSHAFAQDLQTQFPESFTVKVTNPLNVKRQHVLVFVDEASLNKAIPHFNINAF